MKIILLFKLEFPNLWQIRGMTVIKNRKFQLSVSKIANARQGKHSNMEGEYDYR